MSGVGARMSVVVAVVFAALWMLVPTFLPKESRARIEAAAERAADPELPAPATPDPWWVKALPSRFVTLGLDLRGGIDLTLDVDVEEAAMSTAARALPQVRMLAERENVKIADVRRHRKDPAIMVIPGEGSDAAAVRAFMAKAFGTYVFRGEETVDDRTWQVFAMRDEARAEVARSSVDQALETIRNRIDETGTKEPGITRKGERAISIQLPGETDVVQAVAAVGTTAQLEFILVDEEAMAGTALQRVVSGVEAARAALPPEDFAKDAMVSEWLVDNGWLRADQRVYWEYERVSGQKTPQRGQIYVLKGDAVLTGDDVNDARDVADMDNVQYYVSLEFKPRGQAIFADVTGANIKRRFAIVLDGQIKSAPVIQTRINGAASITMGAGTLEEQAQSARMLALVLRTGALPAPVEVGEVRTVGASLGQAAVEEGVYGAALGAALVFVFASIYYRLSGVLAVLSLVINAVLVVALLAALGATLTLPGICGIALTIGMAVDCNVIIYERIREELRDGRSARAAISIGFERAFAAVFDSNIATLLAGVVLYSYGTGPLRGFGVTLMLGVFTTMFTGVFVTRTLMELAFGRERQTSISI
jgi:preprotein translocase subunit SecD